MRTSHKHTHTRSILALALAIVTGGVLIYGLGHLIPSAGAKQTDRGAEATKNRPAPPPVSRPDQATRARVNEFLGRLPLRFEPNQGQTDARAKFISRGRGYTLFLTNTEAVLSLYKTKEAKEAKANSHQKGLARKTKLRATLRMKMINANATPQMAGLDQLPGKSNYFIGSDPAQWRTDIPQYAKVQYKDVYPGVDLVYYGKERLLEYDFVVAPGVNPKVIKLAFEGAEKIFIDKNGNLILRTKNGDVRQHKPFVYQEVNGTRQQIAARYVIRNKREVGFEIGAYDPSKTLMIDPVLSYSTFLGGTDHDDARAITVDPLGNIYVTGSTDSPDFPTTAGAFDTLFNNNGLPDPTSPPGEQDDAYVTKINPSGTALIYSTYLGGGNHVIPPFPFDQLPSLRGEEGNAIGVDTFGNAYVVGTTDSADFPTTANAFFTNADLLAAGVLVLGGPSVFITKLNAAGNGLLYSSYLSGLLGPPPGPFPPFPEGPFPGTLIERGTGIAVCDGTAWVTGYTNSAFFPTTPNSVQPTKASDVFSSDAFVSGINTLATPATRKASLIYSTYLGGKTGTTNVPIPVPPGTTTVSIDQIQGIALDFSGNIYVAGHTTAIDFPTTPNAFQPTFASPPSPNLAPGDVASDAFVAKICPLGQGKADLLYSTFLGGSGVDIANAIAVDQDGFAYVTGITTSTHTDPRPFPRKNEAQTTHGGGRSFNAGFDIFLTKLDTKQSGTAGLLYSTYLGGNGEDFAFGVKTDENGNAYIVGGTIFAVNQPPNVNSFPTKCVPATDFCDTTYAAGFLDALVAKINTRSAGAASLRYSTFLGGSRNDLAIGIAMNPGSGFYVVGFTNSVDFPILNALQPNLVSIPPVPPNTDPEGDAFIAKFGDPDVGDFRFLSDQRAGSVLIFNLYSSSASNPTLENTRINITNTNDREGVNVHLFFVDGRTCSVADAYVCLTKNQTVSFLTSDIDPGTKGYIVAVAVDDVGCPRNFNFLIGDEYIKLASGHHTSLGAEAIAAGLGCIPCKPSSTTATLVFDGISYGMLPRVLAVSSIPSAADGNSTLLVINQMSGSLLTGADRLGSLFGIMFDDQENPFSFTIPPQGRCQVEGILSNTFPRTTPPFGTIIPAGRTGWMKFWATADTAILGVVINFNAAAATSAGAFNQGHNLHKLTLTNTASFTIPVFMPAC